MNRLQSSLLITFAALLVVGCDTGNPNIDFGIGKVEEVSGKAAQGTGSAMMVAPEPRVKIAGGGLIAVGVGLEEDGKARMERAMSNQSAIEIDTVGARD